jgi:lysozyme
MKESLQVASILLLVCYVLFVVTMASNIKPTNTEVEFEFTDTSIVEAPKPKPEPAVEAPTRHETNVMNLKQIIKLEEGFRAKPYICDAGYVTIGYGTKLHKKLGQSPADFPIQVTQKQAMEWLEGEVAIKDARLAVRFPVMYNSLDPDRRAIILSMAYQMGTSGVASFKNMWIAAAMQDWKGMAFHAADSKWAKYDSPKRAYRHIRVLRGESIEQVYGE